MNLETWRNKVLQALGQIGLDIKSKANDSEVVKSIKDAAGNELKDANGNAVLPENAIKGISDASLYLDPVTKELRANISSYAQDLTKTGSQVFTLDFEPTYFISVHGKTPLFPGQYIFTPPNTFEVIPLMEEGEKVRVVYEHFINQPA